MIVPDSNIAYGATFGKGFCSMRQMRVADGFTKIPEQCAEDLSAG